MRAWRDVWSRAVLLPYVPCAMALYLTGHLVRGARLRLLVADASMGVGTASSIVVIGYAANNILPARLGELVRAGALSKQTGMSATQALAITFVERVADGIAILALLVAGGAIVDVHPPWMVTLERVGVGVFGVALLAVVAAAKFPSTMLHVVSRIAGFFPPRLRDALVQIAGDVTSSMTALRKPRRLRLVVATSLVIWSCETAMFACLLPAVGLPARAGVASLAMGVTNLGILVPSSPGYVGAFHYFCSQALTSQGVPPGTALGFATLAHLTFFVPVTIWGVIAMTVLGIRIGRVAAVAADARRARAASTLGGRGARVVASLEPAKAQPRATRFDRAMVEALVPPGHLSADSLDQAAGFYAIQMSLLPWNLRVLFEIGMATFRALVRVRHGRSFCGLDAARRRRVLERCAFGGFEPYRQLFRPVRSTILLAYYEARGRGRTLPLVASHGA